MVDFLLQTLALYLIAAAAFAVTYILHRRFSLALWAYIAAFLPDWFMALTLLGAENLETTSLFSHTIGIFLYPIALLILDIFLIEASFLRYLKPLREVLPAGLKKAVKAEEVLERFQRYHTIPTAERLGKVYAVGLLGGIVHLAFYLIWGL